MSTSLSIRRRLAAAGTAVLTAGLIAGCSTGPPVSSPAPTSSPLAAAAPCGPTSDPASVDPTPTPSPTPTPEQDYVVRIGSYNIKNGLPDGRSRAGLAKHLKTVDVAGLQEVSKPRLRRLLRGIDGWGSYRAPKGGPAVVFRTSVYELSEDSRGRQVAPATFVGRTPGRQANLGPYRAVITHLTHKATGEGIVVVNYHQVAAVETAGKPRRGEGRRVALHETITENVLDAADKRTWANQVFITGDENVDWRLDRTIKHPSFPAYHYAPAGFEAAWADEAPDGGTFRGPRVIDVIRGQGEATHTRVQRWITESDHHPIKAAYPLNVE